jgi:HK97 family phage portal protein
MERQDVLKNPFKRNNLQKRSGGVAFSVVDGDGFCVPGYTSLDKNPEVMTACRKIAELIGSMTIYLMENTDKGDVRIVNELSKMIDITPTKNMTRKQWVEAFVMTMLLSGRGNAIVKPYTRGGILRNLEPIAGYRVNFETIGYSDYKVLIDDRAYKPSEVLHFRFNPDLTYLWKGQGVTVSLQDIAHNLKQAEATKKGFLETKWKPSLIIKVDAMTEEFSTKEGRKKLLTDYIEQEQAGQPWVIPGEQFQIEQVKPLSLADLAISDTVEVDKRTVASVIGVPPFLLGVGEYDQSAWNAFVMNTIRPICIGIQQEMTNKLILNPKWYLKFNVLSLLDWDLKTISDVYGELRKQGIVDGNEVRDRLGMSPREGLDELVMLENYIPTDKLGDQKKLTQDE